MAMAGYVPVPKETENASDLADPEDQTVTIPSKSDKSVIQAPAKQSVLFSTSVSTGLLAGMSYLLCSMTMVLGNKAIAALADIQGMQMGAVFFQNAVAVALMSPAGGDAITLGSVQSAGGQTFLLAFIFVTMLVSSLTAFQYVGIATVVLMKNFSTMATIVGERLLFGKKIKTWTIVAFVIMFVANMLYAKFDIQYSPIGYFLCMVNVCSTSANALMMQQITKTCQVSKQCLVIYTNFFSLPILAVAIGLRGEMVVILDKMERVSSSFIAANCVVAVMGGLLGYSAMWTAQTLGAGTLAMLGTLNKVPLVIVGALVFGDRFSKESALFCGLGIVAGCIFTVGQSADNTQLAAKMRVSCLGWALACGGSALVVCSIVLLGHLPSSLSSVAVLSAPNATSSPGV